jgi:HD superfamily phosphohydrolase YqeK
LELIANNEKLLRWHRFTHSLLVRGVAVLMMSNQQSEPTMLDTDITGISKDAKAAWQKDLLVCNQCRKLEGLSLLTDDEIWANVQHPPLRGAKN